MVSHVFWRQSKKWVGVVRTNNGRTENPVFSFLTTRASRTLMTPGKKGTAGKKVSGMKRHSAVDGNGLPHALHMTTANVTDPSSVVAMVMKEQGQLVQVERVRADAGYTGKPFAETIQATIGAAVEMEKRWGGLYSPFPPTGATSLCSGMPSSKGRACATNGRTSGLARAAVCSSLLVQRSSTQMMFGSCTSSYTR
jgi:hypothetical protein